MDALIQEIVHRFNYWCYVALMAIGLWAMLAKNNYVKKIIGMNILQTAVILFFISVAAKLGGTIPIIRHDPGHAAQAVAAADYINPLPHVLMLTAIVVAVATLGVALSLVVRIYRRYGTLEEDEVLRAVAAVDRKPPPADSNAGGVAGGGPWPK